MTDKTRAGFVAIIGAPNAGKSTLMNLFVGQKIAIVSPKVQTTRVNMRGILTRDNTQYIFVDTPGIYKPDNKRLLDRSMVSAAWQAGGDSDVILLLVDSRSGFNDRVMAIVDKLKESKVKTPIFLAFNKIDAIEKEFLLPLLVEAQEMDIFKEIFLISAQENDGADAMLEHFSKYLPESPYLYDEDHLTDVPMRLLAAEITREKAFRLLNQEIPYGLAVETVNYETKDDGSVRIDQNILVERDGHKIIVIGKSGQKIKDIGQKSRKELCELLGCKVHLFLKVKVNDKWANSQSFMREIGLDPVKLTKN
ncbi:MAG: GTP-binding protein Era [Alphaproteobacteria bacterium]|jgi:GTP-binding protein Era